MLLTVFIASWALVFCHGNLDSVVRMCAQALHTGFEYCSDFIIKVEDTLLTFPWRKEDVYVHNIDVC